MLIFFWLLAGFGFAGSLGLSSHHIETSINRTIDAVEKMTREDPSLPRLSRKHILNILHNITSGNPELAKIEKMTRDAYRRALSIVRPDSIDGYNNYKETKPPLFQNVPNSYEADAVVELGKTEEIVFPAHPKDPSPFVGTTLNYDGAASTIVTSKPTDAKVECKEKSKKPHRNHRHVYAELGSNESFPYIKMDEGSKSDEEPERFSFNLGHLDQIAKSAQQNMKPDYDMNPSESHDDKVAVAYSTNLKPTVEIRTKSLGPQSETQSSSPWKFLGSYSDQTEKPNHFLPTMPSSQGNVMFELPKKLKSSHYDSEGPAPVYVTPTSSGSLNEVQNHNKKTTMVYELDNIVPTTGGGFAIATNIITKVKPIDMLESIGLRPRVKNQPESAENDDIKISKNMLESNYQEKNPNIANHQLFDFGETGSSYSSASDGHQSKLTMDAKDTNDMYSQAYDLTGFDADMTSTTTQSTSKAPKLDLKKGMENLSTDFRLLFEKFGLPMPQNGENKKMLKTTTTSRPLTTASYLDSFTSFKRLPTSQIENEEMREFLARFGLGGDNRSQKSIEPKIDTREHQIPVAREYPVAEATSYDIRKALENVGLLALVPTAEQSTNSPKTKPTSSTKLHIFKPHEVANNDEQKQKIRKLLNTVKMVQDGKFQDVQKVVTDLVQTTKSLKSGPDPVNLDQILELYQEDMKNQVKKQRQAVYDETTVSTETTADEMTTVSSASSSSDSNEVSSSESPSTPKPSGLDALDLNKYLNMNENSDSKAQADNFAALEESFGGSTAAPDPVLPTSPRSGLYFLVDWNTFLEVGEDGKDKVNLRFQPKAGERMRFLPIKIP